MRNSAMIALAALLLAACASAPNDSLTRSLDDSSGESFTHVMEPLRLATERPGLSVVGKDYLLMAPVVVTGTQNAGQYLWLAVGTTVDRTLNGAPTPDLDRIVLVVDGSLMTFDLTEWRETAQKEPFDVPIMISRSFATPLTNNQLAKIANAVELQAFVTNSEHRSPRYALVHGEPRDWLALDSAPNAFASMTSPAGDNNRR